MTRRPRNHGAAFKAKVTMEAIKGSRPCRSWRSVSRCIPTRSRSGRRSCWPKRKKFSPAAGNMNQQNQASRNCTPRSGSWRLRTIFISGARAHSRTRRKAMIYREHALPLSQQCRLLDLSRSSLYYEATPNSDRDLMLMWLINEIHLKYPDYDSR